MCVTELNIRISNICRNWCIINLLFLYTFDLLFENCLVFGFSQFADTVVNKQIWGKVSLLWKAASCFHKNYVSKNIDRNF